MNPTLTCGTEAVSVCMYLSYREYTSVITNNNSMLRKTMYSCATWPCLLQCCHSDLPSDQVHLEGGQETDQEAP